MNRVCVGCSVLILSKSSCVRKLTFFDFDLNVICSLNPNIIDTDGGRISLSMFGRRGAFVIKLFTTLILVLSGLLGLDDINILLAYAIFVLVWQRELESPIRNEVDEIDFPRGLLGITSAILVGLTLIPMTS